MNQTEESCKENEGLVLATILTCGDPKSWEIATVDCGLSASDFRFSSAKLVFEAMQSLSAEGHHPLNYLAIRGKLPEMVLSYLDEDLTGGCWRSCNSLAALPSYIRWVREANNELLVNDVISTYGTSNPSLISRKIEEALIASSGAAASCDNIEDLQSLYREYETLSESKTGLIGISTGYDNLDKKIYGLRPGELYIIAARPAMGKSAFATNLAINMMRDGRGVYVQALEETKKGILKRMTANIGGIPLDALMTGMLADNDWTRATRVLDDFKNFKLTIDDTSQLTGEKIAQKIKLAAKRGVVDVVIVDHIQEVCGDSKMNRHLQISHALAEIKGVAKELKIPAIVLSQINRGTESRDNKFPTMSDLKESGDIEAKADCVMLLYRPDYYEQQKPKETRAPQDDTLVVSIAKNRNGSTGAVKLAFDGSLMRITERKYEYDQAQFGGLSENPRNKSRYNGAAPAYRRTTVDD